ncbi:7TM diverse intracellular signaling domain-containing protein [Chitinophaga sp. GCM10012297]|uniref:histidine kinase n=1 Tax=Chitinophaga chungangae TaxID=2821488 RepID=A0ABS3YGH0_9BACT|nr:7TM diverse intracellular signaling domain-containing protein [Chitinophaga chungangae]MBO9153776.1 hypothetical protein [Chitinophaga chungangae]
MRRTWLLACFLLNFIPLLRAQSGFYVLEDTPRTLTASKALEIYRHGGFRQLEPAYLNPGFTTSVFWIALPVRDTVAAKELVLLADNPHINHLEWYGLKDSLQLLAVTGDFHPFRQRPLVHNAFAFPLDRGAQLYLLKVDKHNESLQAPLTIRGKAELQNSQGGEMLVNGVLTGIVLLIILFGLFLFITTKDAVYGWYALYVTSMLLWIWANKGLGFRYLWPDSYFFPSRARPVFVLTNLVLALQFLRGFMNIRKGSWMRRPFTVFQITWLALLAVMLWPVDYTGFGVISLYLQTSLPLFSLAAVIFVTAGLVTQAIKGNTAASVYLAGSGALFLCVLLENLYHLGKITLPEFWAHFGMFTGVVLEMIIITFGLAARFNMYRKEKEAALLAMNLQQKTLTDTIVTVEENERKTLADRLHDEIGSMLSLASLQLGAVQENPMGSEKQLQNAGALLKDISHTVRTISHQLTPVAIEKYGLLRAVEDMVQLANASGKIQIELVLLGFTDAQAYPRNFQHTVYRIVQELLQNVLRHAGASHALIQLIEHEDTCSVMVEDNGKGIDAGTTAPGLLRSIHSKVAYLEGAVQIESAPGRGTMVNIDLPLPAKK